MYFSLLCLLFILIQTFFTLLILWKHLSYSKPFESPLKLTVSIVVAAKNEAKHLPKLIKSLLDQHYPTFEIIIINDQSSDHTDNILSQINNERFSYITVNSPHPTMASKKNALNLGINKAKYDWILLTDADCFPASQHWINQMTNHITPKTEIVLGVSPNIPAHNFLSKYIQFEGFYTFLQYSTATLCKTAYMGVGRNLMYKKSLFDKHGFRPHENIKSGDDDLFVNQHSNSQNTEICIEPEGYTFTYPKLSLKEYINQKKRHTSVGKYYTLKSKIITSLYFLSFVGVYIGLIISLFQFNNLLLLAYALLFTLKYICFSLVKKKTSFSEKNHFFILSDFIYFLYLSYSFAINLRKTKVKWK